jgi:hypothetical protein
MEEAFAAFLRDKRIDPAAWDRALSEVEKRIHVYSFKVLGKVAYEQRYLFYFNRWRKLFPLLEDSSG